jgi:endonuclease-3 related protein
VTDQLLGIFTQLHRQYGACYWWPAETPFEVCVGAILTQNTSWANVEKAICRLKESGLLNVGRILDSSMTVIADAIRPAGYYNVKARRLKRFVEWLAARFEGSLELMFSSNWEMLRHELLGVYGIGRETADSILLYAGGKPSFVVDSYTTRLFSRLGILSGKPSYEEVRSVFMGNLPHDPSLFNEYHALIVEHCKASCRKQPLCSECVLEISCQGSNRVIQMG